MLFIVSLMDPGGVHVNLWPPPTTISSITCQDSFKHGKSIEEFEKFINPKTEHQMYSAFVFHHRMPYYHYIFLSCNIFFLLWYWKAVRSLADCFPVNSNRQRSFQQAWAMYASNKTAIEFSIIHITFNNLM